MTKLELEARRCHQALDRLTTEVEGYKRELMLYDPWTRIQMHSMFEGLITDATTMKHLIQRDTTDFTDELKRQSSIAHQHRITAWIRDWRDTVTQALALAELYRVALSEVVARMAEATEKSEPTREMMKSARDNARLQAHRLAEHLGRMAHRVHECTNGTWCR